MKSAKTVTSTSISGSNNEKSKVTEKTSTPQHPSSPVTASSIASNRWTLVLKTATINVLFHLLGIVFGFILFYISFRTKCAHRIKQLMNDTNMTRQLVQQQRDEQVSIVSEYNNKLQQQSAQQLAIETNYQERVAEMKIREKSLLDEQSELTMKHLECIQSKTTLYDQLQSYQQNELSERLQLHNITSECEVLRNKILQQEETIELLQSNSEHQYAKLVNQLNLTKVMLHEKIEEVERLKTAMGNDTGTTKNAAARCHNHNHHKLTKEMTQIQADIKRQQYATMINMYGKSPLMSYYVIMIVQSVDPNNQNGVVGPVVTLEIELNAVYDMPHTTYTFLSMIENQLFHDTSLSPVHHQSKNTKSNKKQSMYNNIVLTGGQPNTCRNSMQQSKLKRSYAEFGYNIEQLLFFTERNTKYKCNAAMHTIGFVEYGPDIEIYYKDNSSDNKSSTKHTCFGQIISGIDSLLLLENQTDDVTKMMRLRIIDTRIVKKDHIIKSSNHPEL